MKTLFICSEDFTGKFKLSSNIYTQSKIEDYIFQYEEYYLKKIFGNELAVIIIQDSPNKIPQTPIYKEFYDSFVLTTPEQCEYSSCGLKYILLALVYYHYVVDNQIKQSITGSIVNNNETSKILSFENSNRVGEIRWNESLDSIEAIQVKCEFEKETYPEFKGQLFKPKYSVLL